MRVKSLLMAAFVASMTLVACDKSENEMGDPNQGTQSKSVTIKLANVQAPQSATRNLQAPVSGSAKLNKFTIFFVDGAGKFYEGYAASDVTKNDALTRTYTSTDEIPTFHYLDPAVTKVIVVGNPAWTTEPANEEALYGVTAAIVDQQNVNNLILVGDALLAKKDTPEEEVPSHTEVYTATVNILPLVARLEIGAFEYALTLEEGATRNYTSLSLNQLAVNNYYGTSDYVNSVSGLVNTSISSSSVWPYLEGLTAGWYTDEMTITLNADNEYKHNVDFNADDAQIYAYNVFPTQVPQVILGLSGTKTDGSTSALYLATKGLNGASEFKAGYVYRMNAASPFIFTDDDLSNPDKCVEMTVTVEPWTVVAVTPDFNN